MRQDIEYYEKNIQKYTEKKNRLIKILQETTDEDEREELQEFIDDLNMECMNCRECIEIILGV